MSSVLSNSTSSTAFSNHHNSLSFHHILGQQPANQSIVINPSAKMTSAVNPNYQPHLLPVSIPGAAVANSVKSQISYYNQLAAHYANPGQIIQYSAPMAQLPPNHLIMANNNLLFPAPTNHLGQLALPVHSMNHIIDTTLRSDKVQRRLQRKAELARLSRKRKKNYIGELEQHVMELQAIIQEFIRANQQDKLIKDPQKIEEFSQILNKQIQLDYLGSPLSTKQMKLEDGSDKNINPIDDLANASVLKQEEEEEDSDSPSD
jgi:hypothetical protein